MLTILTSGDKDGDSEVSELTHLSTSLEVTRRVQIVRQYLMSIPRRRLSGGTEGKTIIPAKTVLQQLADILKTPVILAGVISPGASIPKTLPQVTKDKEGKSNAGGPAEGNDANAQLVKSILQQIKGILKTPVGQAGVVSPGASGPPALPQVTEEEEIEGSAGDPIEGDDAIAQTNAAAKALADAAAAIANAEAAAREQQPRKQTQTRQKKRHKRRQRRRKSRQNPRRHSRDNSSPPKKK